MSGGFKAVKGIKAAAIKAVNGINGVKGIKAAAIKAVKGSGGRYSHDSAPAGAFDCEIRLNCKNA